MAQKTYQKVSVQQTTDSVVKLSTIIRDATKVVEVPLVHPNEDEILVKNLYVGVNAADINCSAGRYIASEPPFDIGFESIGVIASVGRNVCALKPGDTGIVYGKPQVFSEYLYVRPENFVPIQSAKPELIALPICGLTAAIGLDYSGRIKSGDSVLITAAAGGTGHIAVQWAKLKCCHVIGTCSSSDKVVLLKQLGCDRVINYKQESIEDVLTREYPNGVDVIWETIGGSVFETLVKHLAIEGRLVMIGATSGYKLPKFLADTKMPSQFYLISKSLSLAGFFLFDYYRLHKQYLNDLIELIVSNQLRILLDFGENSPNGVFSGIDSIVRGVEHLHSGRSVGKVVVQLL